ncbi:MAG: CapA family protein [Chloroflexota bacterium]
MPKRIFVIVLLIALFVSCAPQATGTPVFPPPTRTVAPLSTATFTSTPMPAALWVSPAAPPDLVRALEGWDIPRTHDPSRATVRLDVARPGEAQATWIYALVAPFPTLADGVSSADVLHAWQGAPTGPFAGHPLWMTSATLEAFRAVLGEPAPGSVRIALREDLIGQAWADMPAWAIVPFEDIQPKWKVLTVDGQSPIRKDFDEATYPLQVGFAISPSASQPSREALILPPSNRDASKLTTLILTGTTAMVDAMAVVMERKGVTYPGKYIRDWTRQADIMHISNEVPFDKDCPYPSSGYRNFILCSDPKYMDLLLDVGTDVVELTGDHFADRGVAAMLDTLAMYKADNLPYYGGGANASEARQPVLMEVNGNKIAFMGCNGKRAGKYPKATDTIPGAALCDYDFFDTQIRDLKAQEYNVIFTFQHEECYSSGPCYTHEYGFHRVADSGAVIVSGSQAHYPHLMEFRGDSFIHYGLGNLFFDQMTYILPSGEVIDETRREFHDRHVFYDGRYLGVELLTSMLEDYARPRPMIEAERAAFLSDYFYFSGWMPLLPTPTPQPTVTLTPIALP